MDKHDSDPFELPADSAEGKPTHEPFQIGDEPGPTPKKRRGPWMLLAGAAAALALVGGGGFLALQAFTAVSQAPAKSMPPETDIYFSVDLLQLTGEDTTGALVDTVRGVLERLGEDVADPEDLIAELDQELLSEAGFDFSNDIRPWIGRTIGVGIIGTGWDPSDYNSTPDMLIAVETRNEGDAREFLDTLKASLAREGIFLASSSYRGKELLTGAEDGTEISIGLSDGVLLAGTTPAVHRGIDAQNGASLADEPAFAEATASLHKSRLFTAWIDASFYRDILEDVSTTAGIAAPDMGLAEDMLSGWEGAAMAVTVTEAGMAFDVAVMFQDGEVPEWYTAELLGTGSVPTMLPADTLAFFEYGSPAIMWSSLSTELMGMEPEYEEELDAFANEFGIHPIDDFVAYLDGALGAALVRSNHGSLAAETGYPIGLVGFVGTSSPDPLRSSLKRINSLLEDEGVFLSTSNLAGNEFFIFEEAGEEMFTFGVTDERLLIGTSTHDLTRIGAGEANLTTNPAYAAALDALPSDDYAVSFFADIAAMVDVFGAAGDTRIAMEPFTAVIGATRLEESSYQGTLLILIDYDE